jgi:hypothetical protein
MGPRTKPAAVTPSEPVSVAASLPPLMLERVLSMREAEEMTSLSAETLERLFPQFVIRLSPRRRGVKLKHCLAITEGQQAS